MRPSALRPICTLVMVTIVCVYAFAHFTVSAEDKRDPDDFYFLGPLQIYVDIPTKRGDGLKVLRVKEKGVSDKLLEVDDELFYSAASSKVIGVDYLKDFANAVLAAREKKSTIKLYVKRNGSRELDSVKIDVGKGEKSGKLFAVKSPLRTKLIDNASKFLADQQEGGLWLSEQWAEGWHVPHTSFVGLSLLASGIPKYASKVKAAAEAIIPKLTREQLAWKEDPGISMETWAFAYSGLFLCECYFAFGDEKFLKAANQCAKELIAIQSSEGYWMHAFQGPCNNGYKECNAASGSVLLFLAAAKRCGIDVPDETFTKGFERLEASMLQGGIGYHLQTKDTRLETRARLGATALVAAAAKLGDVKRDASKQWDRHVKEREERDWLRGHPAPALHFFWVAAYHASNHENKKIKKNDPLAVYLERIKWYASLCVSKDGSFLAQPNEETKSEFVERGLKNTDRQYEPEFSTAMMLLALTAPERKLWIYGGKPPHLPKLKKKR